MHDSLEHGRILTDQLSKTDKWGLICQLLKLLWKILSISKIFILIASQIALWVLLVKSWYIVVDQIFNSSIRVHISSPQSLLNLLFFKPHSDYHFNVLSMFLTYNHVITLILTLRSVSLERLLLLSLVLDLLG